MARYVERTSADWWRTIWRLAVYLGFILFAVFVVYPWRGLLTTVIMVIAGTWLYIRFLSQSFGYRCGKCGKVFQVPTAVNFVSASAVGKNPDGTYYSYKNLTCPHCGARTKARLVRRSEVKGAGTGRLLR